MAKTSPVLEVAHALTPKRNIGNSNFLLVQERIDALQVANP